MTLINPEAPIPGPWSYPPLEPLGSGPLELDPMLVIGADAFQEKIIMDKATSEKQVCIRVYRGDLVDPWDLKPHDVTLDDLAFSLSNECRYAGHVPFYCVGQHSIIVSQYFTDPVTRFAALFHDAEEAYFKDMPSPIKHRPEMQSYVDASKRAHRVIFEWMGAWIGQTLDYDALMATIKPLDNEVYNRERLSFHGLLSHDDKNFIRPWPAGRAFIPFKQEALRIAEQITGVQQNVT
jgi:hypothetical protein